MIKSFVQTVIGTILGVIIGALLGAFWFLKMIEDEHPTRHKAEHTSYSEMYRKSENILKAKKNFRFDSQDIRFKSRVEADDALETLVNHKNEYGAVSVADFYTLVGIEATSEDEDWGWKDLRTAYVKLQFNDCYIVFPKPVRLSYIS